MVGRYTSSTASADGTSGGTSVTSGDGYHAEIDDLGVREHEPFEHRGDGSPQRRRVTVVGGVQRLEHPHVDACAVAFGDHRQDARPRAERERG